MPERYTSAGHRLIGAASVLGTCFVASHVVTVVVTCATVGFGWGAPAWSLDLTGFLAGLFFTVQCKISSTRRASDFRKPNRWIAIWAGITCCIRVLDVLMLFGIVKLEQIYVTPTAAVFWSNVISEVLFGVLFNVTALAGALHLLLHSEDRGTLLLDEASDVVERSSLRAN